MQIVSPRRKRPRLEIIPFIDVMFFLLATFMMVSLAMIKNEGQTVNLPFAKSSSSIERKEKETTITITDKGDIYFNKDQVSIETLPAKIMELKTQDADPRVFLNGDCKATFEKVTAVLDLIRKQGITKIAIQTTKEAKK
ncbi:biopolymer transporter ExbD [Candidatus Methylacidiphilum fumarolicum]|uniref:Biopolymer transport protein n=2 Tax=Candidatus Methylacidiphilum fumarolicum TaxID=591154 RepID=I0JVC4_METFB|nr:biopolymer transporter ExbD [Candidatus Methylacidiphilum fumarolicum]MBW6414901.1 biopolymer transporter ExbD [Candidatus Methylacidiphilum fumarolicum]TFE68340.1 biopolymer transporter [Candidatus Methylacidiphilum fumarolicum]TFE73563.1 biopolymer transporter ExbD [Candidatus Methylacidiphilum fumarolicum]TFE74976.1 biopolymer transporter ExbD [Candidatus Methylacidiphilum fumarolicum]TFE76517.1 biopolymer transporter [Candidatus Methylacidiphilum fumarolicum]